MKGKNHNASFLPTVHFFPSDGGFRSFAFSKFCTENFAASGPALAEVVSL